MSRYYALLQASIAELVASADPADDLQRAQRHNELGHGLATVVGSDGEFPGNYYLACLKSGHFYSYAKRLGLDLDPYTFSRRPRKWTDIAEPDRSKLVSLGDLLRRIPELQRIVHETLRAAPLSFQVAHNRKNVEEASARAKAKIAETGRFHMHVPPAGPLTTTYASIIPVQDSDYTAESLATLGLPFINIVASTDPHSQKRVFVGELTHPSDDLWWDHFHHYKSGYCGTSVIAPFWGEVADPFPIHLAILYALSIVVRYLPSLWHDIEDGKLNHIASLVEYYVTIVDNVVPQLVLERITGTRLDVVQPGGFNAPI